MALLYDDNVFLNCPFDRRYRRLFRAIVFAIHDCGFVARCALELSTGTQNRLSKIQGIIEQSRYGVHDLSRVQLTRSQLPRFNMPLELGIFLGAQRFGRDDQRRKSCLILDSQPYRYQEFISDLAGHDAEAHHDDPATAIRRVRDWLRTESKRTTIPGGSTVAGRYKRFAEELPNICRRIPIKLSELTFVDYTNMIVEWLRETAP